MMKKAMIPVLILFTVAGFIACQKEISNSTPATPTTLAAAKTSSIDKGEPVLFTMNNTSGTVAWSVSPALNIKVNTNGNKATILFGQSGTYTVKAVNGSEADTISVRVTDSVYRGGGIVYDTIALTGDHIQLTPVAIDYGDTAANPKDSSGLVITAATTNTYNCLNHRLLSHFAVQPNGTDYSLSIYGVGVPTDSSCISGQSKASDFYSLYPIADGTHALQVILNGTTYTGSFVKSGSSYTFTWPYTSGVTLSPLVIH
jgi:uncharacterized repeat protein (TIGR01451 family)